MEKIKKSLAELYKEKKKERHPAQLFIDEIVNLTGRSELTVRLWLGGHHMPEPIIANLIANHFNLDPEYVFPRNRKLL